MTVNHDKNHKDTKSTKKKYGKELCVLGVFAVK